MSNRPFHKYADCPNPYCGKCVPSGAMRLIVKGRKAKKAAYELQVHYHSVLSSSLDESGQTEGYLNGISYALYLMGSRNPLTGEAFTNDDVEWLKRSGT